MGGGSTYSPKARPPACSGCTLAGCAAAAAVEAVLGCLVSPCMPVAAVSSHPRPPARPPQPAHPPTRIAQLLRHRHANIPSSEFEFDRVLGPEASQSDVYQAAVKPVVEDVLNG